MKIVIEVPGEGTTAGWRWAQTVLAEACVEHGWTMEFQSDTKRPRISDVLAEDRGHTDDVVQAQLQYLEAKIGYEVSILNGAINKLAEEVIQLRGGDE